MDLGRKKEQTWRVDRFHSGVRVECDRKEKRKREKNDDAGVGC